MKRRLQAKCSKNAFSAFLLKLHPSILFLYPLILKGLLEVVFIFHDQWARAGVHNGEVTSPSQGSTETRRKNVSHAHTHKQISEELVNLTNMYVDCRREPWRNICMHKNNMQTSCRKVRTGI
ncbi:hypothetical protein AMECASPLE_012327 [Ameca splendens]|uniref:Uncharacterized protein n=1 Tax=Ameca splendens TaxID=208324 RepID=A0ABV1A9Z6_9TELE